MKPVLLVDLDGILANLIKKWLAVYNRDYHDNLTPDDITTWEWQDLVKPACGTRIYHYLSRPGFFADLEPIEGAAEALEQLAEHFELCVVTASPKNALKEKTLWVERHLPMVPRRNVILTYRKDLTRGHVIIDDATHNLVNFKGVRIIFDYPYNRGFEAAYRVQGWPEATELLNQFLGQEVPWYPNSQETVRFT